MYTGGSTTSKNAHRVYIYNSAYDKILVGFRFLPETKVLSGVGYLDNAGTLGNYVFDLDATPVTLPDDTWVRIGMSYNTITGELIFKGPGFAGSILGAGNGDAPYELDFLVTAGTDNNVASSINYDNYEARATNSDTLLNTPTPDTMLNIVSIYPNPTNDVINVKSMFLI
jgi:hypothetical protein